MSQRCALRRIPWRQKVLMVMFDKTGPDVLQAPVENLGRTCSALVYKAMITCWSLVDGEMFRTPQNHSTGPMEGRADVQNQFIAFG